MNPRDMACSRAAEIRKLVFARRQPPLRSIAFTKTIDVATYGAKPDSGDNALPAIRCALAAAQESGQPTRVVVASGRYDLYPEFTGLGYCLNLNGAEDLLLEGSQARLVIHNPLAGLLGLYNCRRVLVQDFEVDYDPLPFTQGTVQDVHPGEAAFDLLLDPGYSAFDEAHWRLLKHEPSWNCSSWGMLKDRSAPGRPKPGCDNAIFVGSFERLAERLFRLRMANPKRKQIRFFEPGDRYVHLSRASNCDTNSSVHLESGEVVSYVDYAHALDGSLIFLEDCECVSFMNMLSYASPSYCYAGVGSSWLGFINCAVRLKEGRWHTLDSDGIDVADGRIGPWIEDCFFEAGADDTLVCLTSPKIIRRTADKRQLWMYDVSPLTLRPGDPVLFYNPRDGLPLGKLDVDAVDYATKLVRFAQALPPLLLEGEPALRDVAFNLACMNANAVIRGNTVRNNRRWPVWFYTPAVDGAIIEHNTLTGNDSAAIRISATCNHDASRPACVLPTDTNLDYDLGHILIANNMLADNCYNSREATVQVANPCPCTGGRPSPWPLLKDIVIWDNSIANWAGKFAISLNNTRQAMVCGNQIGKPATVCRSAPTGYVYTAYCEGVTLTDNTLSGPPELPLLTQGPASHGVDLQHDPPPP